MVEIEIVSLQNNDIIVTSEKPFPGEWDDFGEVTEKLYWEQ